MLKAVRMPSSLRGAAAWRIAGWKAGAKRKAIPTSSTQLRTPSGLRATATPSSSRTSALPQRLDAARPPCLATGQPAPATTNAAAVEMLKVPLPSPPVPQVSTASTESSTRTAWSRIDITIPVSSSTVSPRIRRAARMAPIWAGVALPCITRSITARAVSTSRCTPRTSRSSASRRSVSGSVIAAGR